MHFSMCSDEETDLNDFQLHLRQLQETAKAQDCRILLLEQENHRLGKLQLLVESHAKPGQTLPHSCWSNSKDHYLGHWLCSAGVASSTVFSL